MSFQDFISHIQKVGELIQSWENNFHIAYRLSSDGLIAASCIARTFFDLEKTFSMSEFTYIEELKKRGSNSFQIIIGANEDDLKDIVDFSNCS